MFEDSTIQELIYKNLLKKTTKNCLNSLTKEKATEMWCQG